MSRPLKPLEMLDHLAGDRHSPSYRRGGQGCLIVSHVKTWAGQARARRACVWSAPESQLNQSDQTGVEVC